MASGCWSFTERIPRGDVAAALIAGRIFVLGGETSTQVFSTNESLDLRSLTWGPAPTKAGENVVFRALLDSIVVASACPQDLNEINHYRPSSIGIELSPD